MEKLKEESIFSQHFRTFYLQYAGELIFFARQFVDIYTAEDIVHDIFLKIWDKKLTIVVEENIRNYLLSMVQNACYDHLKHIQVKDTLMNSFTRQLKIDELKYYESSMDQWQNKEKVEAIYASIEKLPSKSRDIFKKAYIEGQKHAVIAEELDISVRTVETHIYKALKFLRNNLIIFLLILLL
ncbi:RNA polymerase sigma-70 factor [Proteiniphilum sp. UBA5384]|uniref:RNA polymerase sigma-70 factor n=1 Tax=Proteiniphilum sp. UBA5384 TaxID=1947279 RepID=UPI0025CF0B98|nr:RNA polymerase sigma-70 factor [Proteiniphilum sp. UBA5384]